MLPTSAAKKSSPGIRQFRSGDPMDEKESNRTWECLKHAIHQIHQHNASSLSFEELYRNAYNLVLHKYGELLYNGVQGVVADHLKSVAQSCADCPDDRLLEELKKQWDDHKTTMVMIRDILMYMDRNFVSQYKKVPVYEMGLIIFRENVSGHARVRTRLLTLMLENIAAERRGEQVDRILLKHTVNMLVELGVQGKNVYRECFEDQFLDHTRKFYQDESVQYISQNTCSDYLKKAEKRIREEKSRVENYLHESTMEKIQELCDEEWILAHFKTLIHMENSGCAWMFEHDKVPDLERMYRLFCRVPQTLKEVQRVMMDCICEAGKDILADPEKVKDPVSFISAILSLKHKYDQFVKESFKESKDFQLALKQAFESFLNKDTRTAQYLSLFVDDMFRKGLKGMSSDVEIDASLEQVVTVFRFLQDKDVFENFYKQHLARRLLTGRSVNDEAEKSMISKLKSECGHQYTSKLEGMFQDMKLSEDLMKQYKNSFQGQTAASSQRARASGASGAEPGGSGPAVPSASGIELKVSVLTSGFWPGPPGQSCELPLEIQDCCNRFETFYLAKHTGRRLSWQPNHGSADLKAMMPKSRHELNVSTYQMCVLMLFNTHISLSWQDIVMQTNIPTDELKRHLMSLYVNPKAKILVKCGNGSEKEKSKEPQDNDMFQVNSAFECKLVRIKVPLVQIKSMAGQDGATLTRVEAADGAAAIGANDIPATVEEDRKHLVEAVIVRIMKSRKTLEHNQLVMEVTRHLTSRFQPSPTLIKQRIEKLIEREYLERSQQDRRVYNYLA
mmetsp:Transcript_14203/g.42309  ORF Transcript_14203/g.42309 Transcript_14203/m.42309 type:complete len:789 (-) Transcript_14203:234-2600(-)